MATVGQSDSCMPCSSRERRQTSKKDFVGFPTTSAFILHACSRAVMKPPVQAKQGNHVRSPRGFASSCGRKLTWTQAQALVCITEVECPMRGYQRRLGVTLGSVLCRQ